MDPGDEFEVDSADYIVTDTRKLDELIQQLVRDNIADPDLGPVFSWLDKFQENPILLDRSLAANVTSLANLYAFEPHESVWSLKLLYKLSIVRGPKQVAKFFPTEALLLVKILETLQNPEFSNIGWQAQYILVLWLSALLLAPFKLEALGDDLFKQILTLGQSFLVSNGKERDAASLMLARLIIRRDNPQDACEFLAWADELLNNGKQVFGRLGVLQTSAEILKSKSWHPERFFAISLKCLENKSDLITRLALKTLGRIGLGAPEYLEEVIDQGFTGLDHSSTAVRYTAAKIIGRITVKLDQDPDTSEAAQEIMQALVSGFSENVLISNSPASFLTKLSQVSEYQWHGALLCFAEIIRRGVIPDLPSLIQVVDQGLHFERRNTRSASGSSVRDASCYVCWALFRSRAQIPADLLLDLYKSLVALACFDREINIRRGAAAALQEGLGRKKGVSPEYALALMEKVNFNSVTLLPHVYLDIAPSVLPKPDVKYLVLHGITSFDEPLRRIASQSLPLLMETAEPSSRNSMLDLLLDIYNPGDHDIQHGVLLSLGCFYQPPYRLEDVSGLVKSTLNFSSDRVCEGTIALIAALPFKAEYSDILDTCFKSTNEYVIAEVKKLVAKLSPEIIDEMGPTWANRMRESSTFVVALSQTLAGQAYLPAAAKLPDPTSRAIAISALNGSTEMFSDLINAALDDYSIDKRGDVGSWVREAAIQNVVKHWKEINEPTKKIITAKLWRIAVEPLEKLRKVSSLALATLFGIHLPEKHDLFFYQALKHAQNPQLTKGLVTSIGARAGSDATLHGSLAGTVKYLLEDPESQWLANDLLNLKFSGKVGSCVVRAISRLVANGALESFDQEKLLDVAINASKVPEKSPDRVLSAIAILGLLAPESYHRLVELCAFEKSAYVRVTAAETLFEAGVESEILIETDWSSPDFHEAHEKLQNDIYL